MATREQELKTIENQLHQELNEAERELDQLDEQVRQYGESQELAEGADNHPGDDSDRLTEQERLLTIRGQLSERKDEIVHALEKAKRDEFGLCERCGRPIPTGRLEAIPFARYCVECQEIMDQDGAAVT